MAYAHRLKKIVESGKGNGIVYGEVLSVDPLKISCYDGQWVLEEDSLQLARHIQTKKRDCCHKGCTAEGCVCNMDECVCPVVQPMEVGDGVILLGTNPYTIIAIVEE